MLPRSFVTSTLLMLQESSASTPLARELRYSESASEKIAAMQALLNSDRVLTEIAVEIHGRSVLADKRRLGMIRETLRRSVTVQPAGPEFVSVSLRGNEPLGMGKTLEIVVSQLLETILSTNIDSPAAPQVVQARMIERSREAQLSLKAFLASPVSQSLMQQIRIDPEELRSILDRRLNELSEHERTLLTARTTRPIDMTQAQATIPQTQRGGGILQRASNPLLPINSGAATQTDTDFSRFETAYYKARQDVEFLRIVLASNIAQITGAAAVEAHQRRLQDAVIERGRDLESWRQRFGEAGASGLSFMRAPERILVIDPPRDPDAPVVSRRAIVVMVLGASILLGLGASLLLELLDRRLRTGRQLEALIGVPILTCIPWSGPTP
jgi:hypothetical protein